jgi:hypothetical protein
MQLYPHPPFLLHSDNNHKSHPSCRLQNVKEEIQIANDINDAKDIAITTAQANYCLLHRDTIDAILNLRAGGRKDRGRNDTITLKMRLRKAVIR